MKQKYELKIQIVGDKQVGKSSLIKRFTDEGFSEGWVSVADVKGAEVCVKNILWNIILYDYHPTSDYKEQTRDFKDVDAVIIVFDVTNNQSFGSIKKWRNKIAQHVPVFLIANKSDLKGQAHIAASDFETFSKEIDYCLGTEYFNCKWPEKKSELVLGEIVKTIIQTKSINKNQCFAKSDKQMKYLTELEAIWLSPVFKTENEKIRAILNDYTKNNSFFSRFFAGHSDRKHVKEVDAILTISKGKVSTQIMDELGKINADDDMKTLINFIENKIVYDLSNDNSSQLGMM